MTVCGRCETEAESGDLRCAICALPVPRATGPVPQQARVQILRCGECNAAIAFDPTAQAPRCGFCTATMHVEQPEDPLETATLRIPFVVDRAAAESSLRGWLGKRGWFAPKTLRDEAVLDSLVALSWAAWIVNAEATVAWTADSDEDSQRSAWAPHSGQVPLRFDSICVPASRGLDHEECRLLVPYYDLSKAVGIETDKPEHEMVESFDAQRSAARAVVQRAIEATAKTRVEEHIPGRRFRNIHVACLLESQTTDRVALPAWVMAYRYRGTPYRAIVHGQRPEVVFGSSPKDWRKILGLVGGIVLLIAAIAVIAILLTGCGGDPVREDPEFGEKCVPSGTFAPLTGRAAVLANLNVHVDAGGLIEVDTTSKLLLAMDLVQTGTELTVTAQMCDVEVPAVPLAGAEKPIEFEIPDATVMSVPPVTGTAALSSADETCAVFDSVPITLVLGARLDPADLELAALPEADDNAVFPACQPSAATACPTATGTNCACDQESDGAPGATLIAHNVPAIELDQIYVTLRTSFSLHGQVHGTDSVKGLIDAALATGILACKRLDGSACPVEDVRLMKTLNPIVTAQANNPSTFRAVRVAAGMTCADIIANVGTLFPR